MPVDATKTRYRCPICGELYPTKRKVKLHVKNSDEGDHTGVNGFEMGKTIEEVQLGVHDIENERKLHEKIAKAAEQFDEIGNKAVNEIAEAADVPTARVLRVFDDEGIAYQWAGRLPARSFEEMTEKQQEVIKEYAPESDLSYSEISNHVDLGKKAVGNTLNTYGWMAYPIYDDLNGGYGEMEGKVEYNGETEDMLGKHRFGPVEDDADILLALHDSDVDYTIEVDSDPLDAIANLIAEGHRDIAEELFGDKL